jgi:hypothetical protein
MPPSLTPGAVAAASASFMRLEMARRFSRATIAMMPTVSRFAWGMSAATKSMA